MKKKKSKARGGQRFIVTMTPVENPGLELLWWGLGLAALGGAGYYAYTLMSKPAAAATTGTNYGGTDPFSGITNPAPATGA